MYHTLLCIILSYVPYALMYHTPLHTICSHVPYSVMYHTLCSTIFSLRVVRWLAGGMSKWAYETSTAVVFHILHIHTLQWLQQLISSVNNCGLKPQVTSWKWSRSRPQTFLLVNVCVCVRACVRACVRVCMCPQTGTNNHLHIHHLLALSAGVPRCREKHWTQWTDS